MRYEVLLTSDAEDDLEAIHDFIARTDPAAADRVLDRLVATAEVLAKLPERGSHPRELQAMGFGEYRQVMFGPWRVIYRVIGQCVFIYLIADGRRDMRSLLGQRLLDA